MELIDSKIDHFGGHNRCKQRFYFSITLSLFSNQGLKNNENEFLD